MTTPIPELSQPDLTEVTRQRDALLSVCLQMQEAWVYFSEYDVPIALEGQLNAAIATVTGDTVAAVVSQAERVGALENALISLSSYVGSGGLSANHVDPGAFEQRIRDGIDHIVKCAESLAVKRALADLSV